MNVCANTLYKYLRVEWHIFLILIGYFWILVLGSTKKTPKSCQDNGVAAFPREIMSRCFCAS